ncbi:MAG: hypothetical protein AAF829_00815 [Pseudomonadota bacterium]
MEAGLLSSQLKAWCQSYVAAFSAYDVAAISDHWVFPATILVKGSPVVLPSKGLFDKNTETLCTFYRAQGVAKAERNLVSVFSMTQATASIRVADTLLDFSGDTIVAWEAAYTLTLINGHWRACLADAAGEMAAWADRGTPLGGG